MPIWGSIAVIFVLFFIGGVFSAAEMALVSLRDAQIEQLSTRGKRGRAVKELTSNPNRFLSAVQIGVTLAGFLSSAFGTDSLAGAWVAPAFARWGVAPGLAGVLAVIVVTALISFFSIVISELFSKRLALQRPETMALVLAPIVNGLAKVFRPVIWPWEPAPMRWCAWSASIRRPARRASATRNCARWWSTRIRWAPRRSTSSMRSSAPVTAACAR